MQNQFFVYSTGAVVFAGAGTMTGTVRVGSERFYVDKITGSAQTAANITLLIKQVNKNADIFNVALPLNDIIGTAQLPSIVPSGTLIFDANQNIDVIITSTGADTGVRINFIGWKIRCEPSK